MGQELANPRGTHMNRQDSNPLKSPQVWAAVITALAAIVVAIIANFQTVNAFFLPKPRFPTQTELAAAVRASTDRKLPRDSADPANLALWLELPPQLLASLTRVEYVFNNPTFLPRTKVGNSKSAPPFQARWLGYDCIDDVQVVAYGSNGEHIEAGFSLCKVLGL